jgi:hypothetical protein
VILTVLRLKTEEFLPLAGNNGKSLKDEKANRIPGC